MNNRIKFLCKTFLQAYITIILVGLLAIFAFNIELRDVWFVLFMPIVALLIAIPIHINEYKKEQKEKSKMNVYKINDRYIAAKNADSALGHYLDETCYPESLYFGEMDEGEEDTCEIKIKRLTSKEMDFETVTCCTDGCDECYSRDEPVLYSFREVISKSEKYPCIICWEE
jgi:hypothetical protein